MGNKRPGNGGRRDETKKKKGKQINEKKKREAIKKKAGVSKSLLLWEWTSEYKAQNLYTQQELVYRR